MASKAPREGSKAKPAEEATTRSARDEAWQDRLRTVGDARFVEVQWSGRDHPCWPLPKK
jgi:hypothetical protein